MELYHRQIFGDIPLPGPKDIWHFARPVLAKQYLGELDLGLISARALFAKRRMGKSTFLERDLIPAAKHAGYLTPYLNLSTATHTPAQALVRVLSATLAPKGLPKIHKRLKSVETSAALKGIVEGKLEMEWRDSQHRSLRHSWVIFAMNRPRTSECYSYSMRPRFSLAPSIQNSLIRCAQIWTAVKLRLK